MIFEFGQYKVDIDVEKTKQFYGGAQSVSSQCSCDNCHNFEKAVDGFSPTVKEVFFNIGVDMKKVCECYVMDDNYDTATSLYGGFYHVCGTLVEGESVWKKTGDNTAHLNDEKMFSVEPGFKISFWEEINLLEDDFPLPVIELEFMAEIPWVLEKENVDWRRAKKGKR